MTLDDIHPRYSCSSVLVDSLLYLFGGRGCPTGRQELSPRNYYDLYTVNINNNKVTKLWGDNTSPVGGDFVPSENMVYDRERHCLYIWATLNGGTLLRADIATGKFEHMSLPANANIDSQTLYTNLYYSPEQKSLYSVIVNSEVSGESTVNIFRLDYPPIPVSSLAQYGITADNGFKYGHLRWIIGCMVIAAATAGFFIVRKRNKRESAAVTPAGDVVIAPAEEDESTDTSEPKALKLKSVRATPDTTRRGHNPAIYTYSQAIAHTPRALYRQKSHGHPQQQAAQYPMERQRGRSGQEQPQRIHEPSAQSAHPDWRRHNTDPQRLPHQMLRRFVAPVKSDFSNKTLDLLSSLLNQEDLSDTLKMKIADTLFQHDFINEDALRIKCRLLHKQGRTGVAQSVYASFCKEYKSLMDSDYPHSLVDILESRP